MRSLRTWTAVVGLCGLGLVGLAVPLAGCSPFGGDAFSCDTTEQCGPGGQCEDTHFCSFADEGKCGPGGRSYGPYSSTLTGSCTTDEVKIVDAPTDDPPPAMCAASSKVCFGNAIETCKADGTGYDAAARVPCALSCDATGATPKCLAASSLPVSDQVACGTGAGDLDLQATSGATITIDDTEITCQGCAGGVTSIPRRGTNPNNWFCLKSLMIGNGVEISYATDKVTTLFVAQSAVLDSTIDFDGEDAQTTQGGNGGPGGSDGGGLSADDAAGKPGAGACAGGGGGQTGAGPNSVGGGGGGAGGAGNGGTGGAATGTGTTTAPGGTAGQAMATCDSPLGVPLRGGSGGGGGGDGSCGPGIPCGAPGGGGGGGIQIAVRGDLSGTGGISARGGNGATTVGGAAGGGGGGAGGTILVEAHAVTLSGTLEVTGGNGGRTANRNGGNGAGNNQNQQLAGSNGTAGNTTGEGGGGGGGASGRIRVNAQSAPNACTTSKPATACSAGPLLLQ